jgi:hypothetical protein
VITGTYRRYRALANRLPLLVTKQRRLAARIATVADDVRDEKDLRAKIDALLIRAGLAKGDFVTCAGYDVRHNERDGQQSINETTLTVLLMTEGIDAELIARVITAATDTAETAKFATVTPSKGATVRQPPVRGRRTPPARRRSPSPSRST